MTSDSKQATDRQLTRAGDKDANKAKGNIERLSLSWTAKDGRDGHAIYGRTVEDALDDTDKGVNVYSNEQVTLPDGRNGFIDTRINETIIDYKTHDMIDWTEADAKHYGNEHGEQVRGYMESPDTPDDALGFIIATGRSPDTDGVWKVYQDTLAEYGVGVRYATGGKPNDVLNSVKKLI